MVQMHGARAGTGLTRGTADQRVQVFSRVEDGLVGWKIGMKIFWNMQILIARGLESKGVL
jgi:hypothetical protein